MEVIDYLNANFDSLESLDNIDKTLGGLDRSLLSIDEKLRESIREQAYAAENARAQLATINENSGRIIETIQGVKESAAKSEGMVQSGCAEIRRLDIAKRNITFSITSLKRLIMLIQGITYFSEACMQKRYKDAAQLIEATDDVFEYFADYVENTPEIKELKSERDRLCMNL
jgi:hypothetical protein